MSSHRQWLFVFAVLIVAVAFVGCARSRNEQSQDRIIQIKGSDTVSPLSQAWVEEYHQKNPDVDMSITGGGSGVGFAALQNGTTDIAMASRAIKPAEEQNMRRDGLKPQEFVVASDGIAIIVNPSNKVSQLTISQISRIYTGEISNWKDVGGPDERIVVLSRDKNSGTHDFFLEEVVREGDRKSKKQFAPSTQLFVSNEPIAQEVSTNEVAIGYVGLGYFEPKRHKAIAVSETDAGPHVRPSETTVLSGDYPISRNLYYYTPNPPVGVVKEFIDYVLSPKGQSIVSELGFIPVQRAPGG